MSPARKTRAQERTEELEVSPSALLAQIEDLKVELEEARGQAEDNLASLQRERADFQNFRRNAEQRLADARGAAGDRLLDKVLAIADDFDLAIEHLPPELGENPWIEGVVAIDRKLRGLLESEGVQPIESLGRPFDPAEHDAIGGVPGTDRPDGEVVAELRRGYRIRDRILRPALVMVAQGAPPTAGTPGTTGDPGEPPDALPN